MAAISERAAASSIRSVNTNTSARFARADAQERPLVVAVDRLGLEVEERAHDPAPAAGAAAPSTRVTRRVEGDRAAAVAELVGDQRRPPRWRRATRRAACRRPSGAAIRRPASTRQTTSRSCSTRYWLLIGRPSARGRRPVDLAHVVVGRVVADRLELGAEPERAAPHAPVGRGARRGAARARGAGRRAGRGTRAPRRARRRGGASGRGRAGRRSRWPPGQRRGARAAGRAGRRAARARRPRALERQLRATRLAQRARAASSAASASTTKRRRRRPARAPRRPRAAAAAARAPPARRPRSAASTASTGADRQPRPAAAARRARRTRAQRRRCGVAAHRRRLSAGPRPRRAPRAPRRPAEALELGLGGQQSRWRSTARRRSATSSGVTKPRPAGAPPPWRRRAGARRRAGRRRARRSAARASGARARTT